jgi:hypothetical protein
MSNVVKTLVSKYNAPKGKFKGGAAKFNPSIKWVEYSIDLIEAKRLLQAADFTSKFELLSVINKIESKVKFHENHADFDLQKAISDLRLARKLLRL